MWWSAWDVRGGIRMRTVMGKDKYRWTCGRVRPSAVPAIFCPTGSEVMPARICSAIRADVNSPRHMTAVQNVLQVGLADLIMSPSALGKLSGTTKYHRNI